jgi:hypothetical protein
MLEKTKEQIWADWVAKQSGGNFLEMLDAQTEDAKYQTLAQLLSKELEQTKKPPRF